jgi:MSHA biogenesis protein MshO
MRCTLRSGQRQMLGLTLLELIVSLILVGILSAMTAVFLRVPMQSYFVSRQRIDLTDSVELAMRHMDQEIRQSLPSSVRRTVVGSTTYIEFLATRGSGRYRTDPAGGPGVCPGGDQLSTGFSDDCTTTLGQLSTTSPVVAGDYLVIGNKGQTVPSADAYRNDAADGPNKSRITAFTSAVGVAPHTESRFLFNSFKFAASTSQLFYVVSGPVTYACDAASGQLLRYSGYPIAFVQPSPPPSIPNVIVSNLSVCNASYQAAASALTQGIVVIDMTLQNSMPGGQEQETANFLVHIPVSKTP